MLISMAAPARAGPPYLTDDPQPTDQGHWEIYNFATGFDGRAGLDGEAGLDLNYGAAKDLQLTAVLPLGFEDRRGFSSRDLEAGAGVIELAVKYKVLHQADGSWAPDVSLFPRVFAPTDARLGPPTVNLFLPLWAEKDFQSWQVFGGGGYQINPGNGQRDFWQGGIAITRDLNKRLNLGVEFYGQTADTARGGEYQAINFGLTYKLIEHWSLLTSAGPTWNGGEGRGGVFYLALKADY
jgi:hypothetical protein